MQLLQKYRLHLNIANKTEGAVSSTPKQSSRFLPLTSTKTSTQLTVVQSAAVDRQTVWHYQSRHHRVVSALHNSAPICFIRCNGGRSRSLEVNAAAHVVFGDETASCFIRLMGGLERLLWRNCEGGDGASAVDFLVAEAP